MADRSRTPTPAAGAVVSAAVHTEVTARLDAAAANVSYALLGELEPTVAMAGVVVLIEQARRFLEAAGGEVLVGT